MAVPLLDATYARPLEHWIRNRTIRYNKNFMSVVTGETGSGKTTPKDTPVLMADGSWKMCQDVKVGDEVISLDKNRGTCFEIVLETYSYFSDDIYEVKQRTRDKKSLYFCTGDHKIPMTKYVFPRKKGKRPKELRYWTNADRKAREIANLSHYTLHGKGMYGFTVPKINKFRNDNNIEIEPYTLGAILGDGHFNKSLNITSIDKEIINEIILHYKLMSINNKKGTNAKSYAFSLTSELAIQLEKLGLKGKLSGNKFIPFKCKTASVEYRKRLLSGLLDTDGHVSKNGQISITTKSKQLAEDIKFLVHSLGGYGRIKKVKKSIKRINFVGEYYNVSMNFKENVFYCKVPRKRDRLKSLKWESKNHVNKKHVSIKVTKTNKAEMVYGFMVSGDSHYFITNDFMVTHNSYAAIALGEGVDPNFTIKNIHTSAKEMLEFLTDHRIIKGTAVVLDEAGVNFSSRKWMSRENRHLGELFQTFRWMNICFIMTVPNFSFVDVQQRKLIHFSFESPHIDFHRKMCFTKGKYWMHDDFSDHPPRKYFPILRYPDGKLAKVARIGFKLASKDLIKQYEVKKKDWNLQFMNKAKKAIVDGLDPKKKAPKNDKDWTMKYQIDAKLQKIADNVMDHIDEYSTFKGKNKGWTLSTQAIRADHNIKGIDSLRIVRFLNRKDHVKDYLTAKGEKSKMKGD